MSVIILHKHDKTMSSGLLQENTPISAVINNFTVEACTAGYKCSVEIGDPRSTGC